MNIVIPNIVRNNIYEYVKKEYPKECCGLLIGKKINNILICKESVNTKNIAANPYQFFEIDNQEIINTQKKYRKNDLTIIGHYHSHPNSALKSLPSKRDVKSIFDTNLCWIIIGINANAIEISAYFPIKNKEKSYNFKKINIDST